MTPSLPTITGGMNILAFDQSCTAAAAVFIESDCEFNLHVMSSEVHRPKGSGIHRMMDLRYWFDNQVSRISPHLLIRELHNQRTWGAANQLHALAGFIDATAWEYEYIKNNRYLMIPVTTWKKFCLGKGNTAKDTAYMMKINKFFRSCEWLDANGMDPVEDDNIGDAICLAITGFIAYRCHTLKHEVDLTKIQTDALKKSDSMFDYGSL